MCSTCMLTIFRYFRKYRNFGEKMKLTFCTLPLWMILGAVRAECLNEMEIPINEEEATKMSFSGFEPSVNR